MKRTLNTPGTELDAVVGTDRLPCWDDREQLPYLRAVIKEVHRWAPFADAGMCRSPLP